MSSKNRNLGRQPIPSCPSPPLILSSQARTTTSDRSFPNFFVSGSFLSWGRRMPDTRTHFKLRDSKFPSNLRLWTCDSGQGLTEQQKQQMPARAPSRCWGRSAGSGRFGDQRKAQQDGVRPLVNLFRSPSIFNKMYFILHLQTDPDTYGQLRISELSSGYMERPSVREKGKSISIGLL